MTNPAGRPLLTLSRLLATHSAVDDASLLRRHQSGNDAGAFGELVHRHGPLVLGVCRRMLGHAHDAEDAFQATFLALVQSGRWIRNPNALSAWLYGTATRVCRKALGRRRTPQPKALASSNNDPFEDVAWKEVRGLLDIEMSRLPAALREPLVLCYFNGLTREEAADKLGWSRRTLIRRLDQARSLLRLRLEQRGVAALGLSVAVLGPQGLAASVPQALKTATIEIGTGQPASAAVRALAGGLALQPLKVAAALMALLLDDCFISS
jgi:RNA polymerase sigma factor (sigma-70 family)